MLHSASKSKGFTLLELLIVIAILAVLAAVTVVVLNPAELLARARDSQRMADLAAIRSAISFYMLEVSPAVLNHGGIGSCIATHAFIARTPVASGGWTLTTTTSQVVDGTGWIRVRLTDITAGSPLPVYPVDPTNTGARMYVFGCRLAPLGFALVANLESAAHTGPTAGRTEAVDGGVCPDLYETGTIIPYFTGGTGSGQIGQLFGVC